MTDTIPRQLPSGRFLLRVGPELHALLRDEANRAELSLNEYCVRKLAAPSPDVDGPAVDIVRRAAAVTGGRLRGLLVFGSWARDELADTSDVDLLVVVHADLTLERALYRRWDESPLLWGERRVEPHFVHLPRRDDRVTGLWAEAARDGIALFDPDFSLSRHLVHIRGRIFAGELVRHEIHGHPYWVDVA